MTFHKPFTLEKSGEILPAGEYVIETLEEPIREVSFLAYRRIKTLLHMSSRSPNTALSRTLNVEPDQLEAALNQDAAAFDAEPPSGPRPSTKT